MHTTLTFLVLSLVPSQTVLVEAEQFADTGGWVHDSQFMDDMGSPFLLAHGLGTPVDDAVTTITLPAAGTYRVLVRTRDWVAPWGAPGQPGRFQVLVDGRALETEFGTEGAEWHWQDGGQVTIEGTEVQLALHDLTGFEGRCDAILLTTDRQLVPPNRDPEMRRFRRQLLEIPEAPKEMGHFDLVVVGGGIAGTSAAVSAARLGLSVALVQDRPVLGGNNSSEIRVWLQGARNRPPYPRVGDIVAELEQPRSAHYGPENTADLYEDEMKLGIAAAEENLRVFLNTRVDAVETVDGAIRSVTGQDTRTGRRLRLCGDRFADCTGDGAVGFLAGAHYEMTVPGHMGRCNLWNVIQTDDPQPFPNCPWALDLSDKPFPGRGEHRRGILALGGWYWESGFDHDPTLRGEAIRDWNFRAMYGAWDALKNVDHRYPNHKLNWSAHISGKRESRRLLGTHVLSQEDLVQGREFPDGCVPTGWKIDLHLPDPRYEAGFEGDAFIAQAEYTSYPMPFWIPYRCLYSRNIENLLMAGRDISVTHQALGAVRVMRTGGCMGEIVGMAASLCKQHQTTPDGVYRDHLDPLKELMRRGVGRPRTLPDPGDVGPNVARDATVCSSGDKNPEAHPPTLVNDGLADLRRNDGRWLSSQTVPNWIEFGWKDPQSISAVRVISGYDQGGNVVAPVESFVLETRVADEWKQVPDSSVTGNTSIDRMVRFPRIESATVRLLIRQTNINISRIWEIALYAPVAD